MVKKEEIDRIIESQNNPKTHGAATVIGIIGTTCWLIETITIFDVFLDVYLFIQEYAIPVTIKPVM